MLTYKFYEFRQDFRFGLLIPRPIPCKRCTLEFAYAPLLPSVEATVTVQVIDGSWDDHVQGVVTCRTASMENGEMVLLASRDGKMPVNSDGVIELSRRVVSVELRGQLLVSVLGRGTGDKKGLVATDTALFTQMNAGTSHGVCDLGFCKVQVTVTWSFLSTLADMLFSA